MAKVTDELMNHDYDGIQEYDNPMPSWWLNLFYITIIWGVLYLLYFHVFQIGALSHEKYQKEMNPNWTRESFAQIPILDFYHSPYEKPGQDLTPKMRAEMAGLGMTGEAQQQQEQEAVEIEAQMDAESLAHGQEVFKLNCASCHGQNGEGGIGPNLTDDYWIHGQGDISGIATTVKYGVPVKGMIAWGPILSDEEFVDVSSYVLSLHGTDPPNPKAPQGELVE